MCVCVCVCVRGGRRVREEDKGVSEGKREKGRLVWMREERVEEKSKSKR